MTTCTYISRNCGVWLPTPANFSLPWLDDAVRRFRSAWEAAGAGAMSPPIVPAPGTCLLFVDGLRFDIARRVIERLNELGQMPAQGWRYAPVPTVTATAKPAVTPVADACGREGKLDDFLPLESSTGQPARTDILRRAMLARGVQILADGEVAPPASATAIGWTECGNLDSDGLRHGHTPRRHRRGADSGRDRRAFRFGRLLVLAVILNTLCSAAWAETSVRVFAIRGFVGVVFSRGMNSLCDELARIERVDCTVEDFLDQSTITSKAAAALAAGQHLVLVGHSIGGNAALNIAAAMTEKVPLIVTVDPSLIGTTLVPETADIVLNYYQNVDVLGGRATLQAPPGFRGELQNILRYEPHVLIDGALEIHAEIITRIKNMLSARATSSLPVPMPPVRPRRR
jgi:hypothetical protein